MSMKLVAKGQQLDQYHQQCVCQICKCHKHTCPHSQIHIPHSEISSYQKEYTRHPINTWKLPPPERAKPYVPYDYINSKYREDYPGAKPKMREKIVPRVKNQKRDIVFSSTSEYFNHYGAKSVPKNKIFIKDNQYVPDKQPFNGSTTYNSDFPKKIPNIHDKQAPSDVKYPQGYRFNPSTTYSGDFYEKSASIPKNYKPKEKVADKGPHDLNSIYRQDFKEKPQPDVCPILKMPKYQTQISYPSQHISYNKFSGNWIQK